MFHAAGHYSYIAIQEVRARRVRMEKIVYGQGRLWIVLIDDADILLLSDYRLLVRWTDKRKDGTYQRVAVVCRPIKGPYSKVRSLSRLLLGVLNPDIEVDHRNHDTLDNRRDNLRICTGQQNCCNTRRHWDNKSGYKGVSWDTTAKKWLARICYKYKIYHLGCFTTPEEAHEVYVKKAKELFGEFACAG